MLDEWSPSVILLFPIVINDMMMIIDKAVITDKATVSFRKSYSFIDFHLGHGEKINVRIPLQRA